MMIIKYLTIWKSSNVNQEKGRMKCLMAKRKNNSLNSHTSVTIIHKVIKWIKKFYTSMNQSDVMCEYTKFTNKNIKQISSIFLNWNKKKTHVAPTSIFDKRTRLRIDILTVISAFRLTLFPLRSSRFFVWHVLHLTLFSLRSARYFTLIGPLNTLKQKIVLNGAHP